MCKSQFSALSFLDAESDVIYFCLVDDRDPQTVSHCYFTRNSCLWLLSDEQGEDVKCDFTGVIF